MASISHGQEMSGKRVTGMTLWLTGLPCAGKTTIARLVAQALADRGERVELLDGDDVRKDFSAGIGFSRDERGLHLRRVAHLCHLLTKHGVTVVAAFVSPYQEHRDDARRLLGARFIEIYVKTPLEECRRRDVKGMYQRAMAGELTQFTGISAPNEPPTHPELTIHTLNESPQDSAQRILDALPDLGRMAGRSVVKAGGSS